MKFDIVLVDFPFTDLTGSKRRPAVVVKDLEGQNIIVCQITTRKHKLAKYEIALKKQDCEGDIRFDSYIYVDLIATLHRTIVERKIGSIKSKHIQSIINEKLKQLFFEDEHVISR